LGWIDVREAQDDAGTVQYDIADVDHTADDLLAGTVMVDYLSAERPND
jgi:hypothetical protein